MTNFPYKLILLIFLLPVHTVVIANVSDSEEPMDTDVIILTDDNFDVENGGLQNSLVMFHAPWCGHCKRLSPEFSKAATILKTDELTPVALVKVDCTAEGKETCRSFGIRGYPTMKIFKKGNEIGDYKGSRQSEGIIEYMRNELNKSDDSSEDKSEL